MAMPRADIDSAVLLADACAQGMWGSAHCCMVEPLEITQDQVIELGKLGLDCLIMSGDCIDLGRSCHCIAATLATLAANATCARFMMDAPGGSVVKSVLALVDVEEDPCFSHASDVRAAACTTLAFLACHPLGARGDACLIGPFRTRLLQAGAFGALLRAALSSGAGEHCDPIIQQTAAVGIMYLATMAGAVDPAELAMYAALMTSNTNVEMVEYLMAGMWILLKVPANRKVLGGAFKVNPASSKLASTMMEKLQDTIEVADVTEHVNRLAEKIRGKEGVGGRNGTASPGHGMPPAAVERSPGSEQWQQGRGEQGVAWSPIPEDRGNSREGGEYDGANANNHAGVSLAAEPSWSGFSPPSVAPMSIGRVGSTVSGPARPGLEASVASITSHGGGSIAGTDVSYGALAAAADTLDDKLAVIEHKRRNVLFNHLIEQEAQGEAEEEHATSEAVQQQQQPSPQQQQHSQGLKTSRRGSMVGARSSWAGSNRVSCAGSVSSLATSRGVQKIKELSETLQQGEPTSQTLERMRSINEGVQRSMDNLDNQLGSSLGDHWGLDTLVRVGETWLPRMLQTGAAQQPQRRSSATSRVATPAVNATAVQPQAADVPLLKLFEFLTASMCLYVIEEHPSGKPPSGVWSQETEGDDKASRVPKWWTVDAQAPDPESLVSPLLQRTLHILMTSLELRIPMAWKSVQLSVVMLWNAAVQSASVERHQVDANVSSCLLALANDPSWPPTLRDMAAGHLQHLMETHRNLEHLGAEHRRHRSHQGRERLGWGLGGRGPPGKVAGAAAAAAGTAGKSAGGKHGVAAKFVMAREKADAAKVAEALASVAGKDGSAGGGGSAQGSHGGSRGGGGGGGLTEEEQQRAASLDAAAGPHPGLVPFMLAMVRLVETGHPLLELRGARGIARTCFAAARGAPNGVALLREAKTTAAEAGAVAALVELLRRTASKYLVALEGGVLLPPPLISTLSEGEYSMYERDMNSKEGMLELLLANLGALLNLTTLQANQPKVARRGLMTLLSGNTSLYTAIVDLAHPSTDELRVLDLLAAIIQNLAAHPHNRTRMYRAELRGTAAMDRVLQGPASPEPTDTTAEISIARERLLAGATGAGTLALEARTAAARMGAQSPPPPQQQQQQQPGAGARMSSSAGQHLPSSSPLPGVSGGFKGSTGGGSPCAPRLRVESPAGRPARQHAQDGSPPQGHHASGSPGSIAATRPPSNSPHGTKATQDVALAAAATIRPKVLFPPIGCPSNPDDPTAGAGTLGSPQSSPQGSPLPFGLPPPQRSPQGRPGTVHNSGSGALRNVKSCRSRGTSVWTSPGSPIAPPDSREQFLIWLDSTFTAPDAAAGPNSGDGAAGGGYREEAQRRRQQRLEFEEQWGLGCSCPDAAAPGAGMESRGLQRLLCRPLYHLWQDSPEAFSRQGNARWSPSISEYREAKGHYNLHSAAKPLLQCDPPAKAPDIMAGTTQVLSTGRLADTQALALERPSTRERVQGRCPLTVMQPRPELMGANGTGRDGTQVAGGSFGPGTNNSYEQQEGAFSRRATQQAVAPADNSGDEQQAFGAAYSSRSARGVTIAATPTTLTKKQEGPISLKIALSPQRPRTLVAFDERVFTTDSSGMRPVLTLFEHVEGSKVSEGLFTEYTLPNGKKVFMYCAAGSAMDEAEVGPVQPPPRPTTVPLALQQSMPLAEVLDFIAQPPGSAPPYVPAKPVPRLVPLPPCHTLSVKRRDRLDARAFGALREDNLQLVITANSILKTTTSTVEEDVYVPAKEEREPWSLPMSIFKGRTKEADARAFYDGGATLDKMFERDWGRACSKEKFMSMLARENRACAANKPDKVALAEVHDVIKRNYQTFLSAFTYYAAQGGNDPYHMPLNAFTSFLDDCSIPDSESQYIKRSDCDTIFIVANFISDKKSPEYAVIDEHASMRFEFMEAIVRLAISKYGKGQETDDLATAVELLIQRNMVGRLPLMAKVVPNDFRTERLYTEEVDLLLKKHQVMLKALYSRYRLKPTGGGLRPKVLKLDGWLAFMTDARLIDSQFTLSDACLAFLWARMHVIDEIKDYGRYTALTFVDFLEALGRVADMKSLPTASDLDEARYSSILDWALDKERLEGAADQAAGAAHSSITGADGATSATVPVTGAGQGAPTAPAPAATTGGTGSSSVPAIFRTRPSARFGAPKPRPLYAKLELLLDLTYRRLYWDPSQPESVFSLDALLRTIRKIDKELGP